LHMAQLMPLPLTVSCFSKIQIAFTFLVPAHLGSPGKRAVKRVCVCVKIHHLLTSVLLRAAHTNGAFGCDVNDFHQDSNNACFHCSIGGVILVQSTHQQLDDHTAVLHLTMPNYPPVSAL